MFVYNIPWTPTKLLPVTIINYLVRVGLFFRAYPLDSLRVFRTTDRLEHAKDLITSAVIM